MKRFVNVLYEDNHLLALDKPPGMLTSEVEEWGRGYLKEKYSKPGNVFLHAVHQIDRPVTGIVMLARTSKALSRMNAQIREKSWKKVYRACYEGVLPSNEGHLVHFLEQKNFRAKENPRGKRCELLFRSLGQHWVEIELLTGRYHQIRAQLAAIGCPIRGDSKYGAKSSSVRGGIELYHYKLSFLHPVTSTAITIISSYLSV